MKSLCRLIVITLIFITAASAAPFDKGRIAADATWIIHIDVESFANTALGRHVATRLEDTENKHRLNILKEFLSFDPLEDVKEVSLYGTDFSRENGAAVVRVDYEQEKFLALLRGKTAYQEIKIGDHVIHHWRDIPPGQNVQGGAENSAMKDHYAAMYSDNLLVLASDTKTMQTALNVLDGDQASLDTQNNFSIGAVPEHVFLTIVGQGFAQSQLDDSGQPQAAIMTKIRDMIFTFGEKEENLLLNLNLTTEDNQSAMAIKNLLQGLLGMAMMKQDEAAPQRQKLLQALNFSLAENVVGVDLIYPVDEFAKMLKQQDGSETAEP